MNPRIGVIGGTGLYSLLQGAEQLHPRTPYGATSSPITVGLLDGVEVAFLTRHGAEHSVPPHKINYRANIWALASLGVKALVTSAAVGGLQPFLPPGTFVIPDQVIDRTWGRKHTFFDKSDVQHLVAADPFDPQLHTIASDVLRGLPVPSYPKGSAVVIQGPRFSTRAESEEYAKAGHSIINMTLAPEVFLAQELGLGVVNVSFITDSDSVVQLGHEDAVTPELVTERLVTAQPLIRQALTRIVARIPADYEFATNIDSGAIAAVLAKEPKPLPGW